MREKDMRTLKRSGRLALAGLLACAGGIWLAAAPAPGGSASWSVPATSEPATASKPATASAPATRVAPAIQAEVLLKAFPANANLISARSDARNFTIEGRIRDIRTVTVDAATGIATQPAQPAPPAPPGAPGAASAPAPKTEVRIVLVGRGQSDDVAAHFTCHMDKASQDAALALKPDQLVRLTGTIGTVVPAADRIDLLNCHDLSITTPLNTGDQIVGNWRASQVMIDGTALKKYNQQHNLKVDDIPDGSYVGSQRLDLVLRADSTFAAELDDNAGAMLKKVSGRYTITKDGPDEARLRLDFTGGAPQEIAVSVENGMLKFTPPGMNDKCLMPDQHLSKLDGMVLAVDTKALKDQTMRWFAGNILPNAPPNIASAVSTQIDNAFANHQGYVFNAGSATIRSGRTTLLICAFGKFMALEFTPAETQANIGKSKMIDLGNAPGWGTLMVPEVKIDAPVIQNRTNFDPNNPLVGKFNIRGLRRMPDAQYQLMIFSSGGSQALPLEKPGPDPQTVDVRIDRLPPVQAPQNPRLLLLLVVRQPKPNDLFNDPKPRVISEPMPVLLDLAPAK